MALLQTPSDVTGSRKFEMAAAELELPISKLEEEITEKFQRLHHVFWDGEPNDANMEAVRRNRK